MDKNKVKIYNISKMCEQSGMNKTKSNYILRSIKNDQPHRSVTKQDIDNIMSVFLKNNVDFLFYLMKLRDKVK